MMTCNLRKHSEQRLCCGGCLRAFSSMDPFDWHRRGGKCADPREHGGFVARQQPGVVGTVEVWGGRAGEWSW